MYIAAKKPVNPAAKIIAQYLKVLALDNGEAEVQHCLRLMASMKIPLTVYGLGYTVFREKVKKDETSITEQSNAAHIAGIVLTRTMPLEPRDVTEVTVTQLFTDTISKVFPNNAPDTAHLTAWVIELFKWENRQHDDKAGE